MKKFLILFLVFPVKPVIYKLLDQNGQVQRLMQVTSRQCICANRKEEEGVYKEACKAFGVDKRCCTIGCESTQARNGQRYIWEVLVWQR